MTNYNKSSNDESNFRDLLDQTYEKYFLPRKAFIAIRKNRSKVRQKGRTISVSKKQPSCQGKIRYTRICSAVKDADKFVQDIALMFDPMHVYTCRSCTAKSKGILVFHKGHARNMLPSKALIYAESARNRAQERANS